MRASRAPWWVYIIAGSFLGYFVLMIYTSWFGRQPVGISPDFSSGRMGQGLLREVVEEVRAAQSFEQEGRFLTVL